MAEPQNCEDCSSLKSGIRQQIKAFQLVSHYCPQLQNETLINNILKMVGEEEDAQEETQEHNMPAEILQAFNTLRDVDKNLDPGIFLKCFENLMKKEKEEIGQSQSQNQNQNDGGENNSSLNGGAENRSRTAIETDTEAEDESNSALFLPDSSVSSSTLNNGAGKRKVVEEQENNLNLSTVQESQHQQQKRIRTDEPSQSQSENENENEIEMECDSESLDFETTAAENANINTSTNTDAISDDSNFQTQVPPSPQPSTSTSTQHEIETPNSNPNLSQPSPWPEVEISENDFPISFLYSNSTSQWTAEKWMEKSETLVFPTFETLLELSDYLSSVSETERELLRCTRFCFNGWNLGSPDSLEFFFVHGPCIQFLDWNPGPGSTSDYGSLPENRINVMMGFLRAVLTEYCPNIKSLGLTLPLTDKTDPGDLFPENVPYCFMLPNLKHLRMNVTTSKCKEISGVVTDILKKAPNLESFNDSEINWPLLLAFSESGKMRMIRQFLFKPDGPRSLQVYSFIIKNPGPHPFDFQSKVFILDLSGLKSSNSLWGDLNKTLRALLPLIKSTVSEFHVRKGFSWLPPEFLSGVFPILEKVKTVHLQFKESVPLFPENIAREFSRIFPAVHTVHLEISKVEPTLPWLFPWLDNISNVQSVESLVIDKLDVSVQIPWIQKSLKVFPMVQHLELLSCPDVASSRIWPWLSGLKRLKIVFKWAQLNSTNQISGKLDEFFTGFTTGEIEALRNREEEELDDLEAEFRDSGSISCINSTPGNPSIMMLGMLKVLDICFVGHFGTKSPGFPQLLSKLSAKFGFALIPQLSTRISLAKLTSNDKPRVISNLEGLSSNVTIEDF